MRDRRLVGIDLGITSVHTVRVLAGDGAVVCRRKAIPTLESLVEVERAALTGAPPGVCLEVVVEPTGPSWLPIAVFFCRRGHTVYRVSSAKAHDLRRVLSRQAKSNGIDADTLARLPLVDPAGLHPLQLPDAPRAALDRRVRACDRLTQAAAGHKRRIKDLVRQLMPMTPLAGELGQTDLAVLERYADPHALVAAGRARLHQVIAKASRGQQGAARAEQWLAGARAALELYADHPAVAFEDLAAEVATEIRLLAVTQAELDRHATQRESCYRWVDPAALARSLPGLAEIGGPALAATMGPASRFATAAKFRAFTGLAPRASETGQTDRKGQPISKAGNRLLRTTLVRAADNARRVDPQLARLYHTQMVERGKDHLGAVCVVAAHLAERAWAVMDRGMPYVICDTDGTPVTAEQAKAIIAKRYTVPEQVRRQRRSKKGKALSKSFKDMSKALKAQRGDPPPHHPVLAGGLPPSSKPYHPLDTQAPIGNQISTLGGLAQVGPSPRLLTSRQLDPLVDPTDPDEPMLHGRIRRVELQGLGDLGAGAPLRQVNPAPVGMATTPAAPAAMVPTMAAPPLAVVLRVVVTASRCGAPQAAGGQGHGPC